MLKKILYISLIVTTLIFSGCGDDSGEKRLEAQNELDSGNYDGVIGLLEPTSASTTEDEYNLLASAYMAKAGFSLVDIVDLMSSSNDTGGDGFASFASSIATERSDTTLSDLGIAIGYYDKILGTKTCTDTDLTGTQKDICMFKGLSSMVKTATTLSYLGDLANFGSDTAGNDDELTASACAMQYAFDGSVDAACTKVDGDQDVLFDSNNTYDSFSMTVNATSYYYLKTDSTVVGQTIITDGNCSTAFVDCDTANNTDCFACPVNKEAGSEDLTVTTILVDVLNEGTDAIIGAVGATGDSTDTDSIAADVEEYKAEVGGADGVVTEQEIIDYINAQNAL